MDRQADPPAASRSGTWLELTFTLNGERRSTLSRADRRLAELLRDDLGLTGTKVGCAVGTCGACTVLVDGAPTSSCVTLAAQIDGRDVLTIEGVADHEDGRRVQESFVNAAAFQCGFCTSGQIMNAIAIVRGPELALDDDQLKEQLRANLCRCTGYYPIIAAIRQATT